MTTTLINNLNKDIVILRQYFRSISKVDIPINIVAGCAINAHITEHYVNDELEKTLINKQCELAENTEQNATKLLDYVLDDLVKVITKYDSYITKPSKVSRGDQQRVAFIESANSITVAASVLKDIEKIIKEENLTHFFDHILPGGKFDKITEQVDSLPHYIYRLVGEYWELQFKDESSILKNSKGLKYIHDLLSAPHIPINCNVLTQRNSINPDEKYDKVNSIEEYKNPERMAEFSKENYENAIEQLKVELQGSVPGSIEYYKIEQQISDLKKAYNKFYNVRGEERLIDQAIEKSRQAVLKAISRDLKRLQKSTPKLYLHLTRYICTGYGCIYDPPPDGNIDWQLK